MSSKILIVFLSVLFSFFQSSVDLGILNLSVPLIFFIYLLFFYSPNDALLSAFISGLIMDFFGINFGAYLISYILIVPILYYIEKEFLPNDRFSTYVWMNFIGTVFVFLIFAVYNFIIKGLNLGVYYFNFKTYLIMFLHATIFNAVLVCLLYYLTHLFSDKAKNKFISIG